LTVAKKDLSMRELHQSSSETSKLLALILIMLSPFAVCVAQQPASSPVAAGDSRPMQPVATRSATGLDDRYRIGPGDLISITTLDYPQLSADSVRVDSQGMILLPLMESELQAACRTEGELAREISKRYLKYLKAPDVKVFVKEYQSQTVAMIGAVRTPGRFQLQRRVRLLELLTFVGGPADSAGQTIQIIHSTDSPVCSASLEPGTTGEDSALVVVKLSETLRGTEKANPFVQPGDIITVPDAEQYYILGNVAKPSAYQLKEQLTLGEALAIAGGLLQDTNKQKIRIIRHSADGAKTEVLVDLNAKGQQSSELALQPNDIVEVPKLGGAAMAFKGMIRTMVPMMTGLPLRVVY
jgi:polysaccharide biosynthesis/export protein